jgi:hypothetical protein
VERREVEAPSNRIIHTVRYFAIFRDWDGQRT